MKNRAFRLSLLAIASASIISVSCNQAQSASTPASQPKADGSGLSMAYVHSDSLLAKYELHQMYKGQLEEKAKEIESELQRRSALFQENVANFEKSAGSMSQAQIQQEQMELQQLQQNLMRYRDERTQELADEEQELNELIMADMDSILKIIQEREGYDFIFSYGPASELLLANPAYDITDIVVKDLNEAYQKNKATKKED
ncbi:OmpH family outer membrane protein [Croceimicrobium sp.]|uniref:OmpH family outer membrane protein n=1 Tax=Croceimicrobium sp. TaxID=2828340 RepID=UPI003BAD5ED2